MDVRKIVARLLMAVLCCGAMCIFGCSSDSPELELWDRGLGYFCNPGSKIVDMNIDHKEGAVEIKMIGTPTETVIPIVIITFDYRTLGLSSQHTWETWHRNGAGYMPELQYKADGYESYPNRLDYTYTFKWATFSTVKEQGSENGLLRVSYEANPYNVSRELVVYLENEDSGTLILRQDANPDGIDAPEGTFFEDGLHRGF